MKEHKNNHSFYKFCENYIKCLFLNSNSYNLCNKMVLWISNEKLNIKFKINILNYDKANHTMSRKILGSNIHHYLPYEKDWFRNEQIYINYITNKNTLNAFETFDSEAIKTKQQMVNIEILFRNILYYSFCYFFEIFMRLNFVWKFIFIFCNYLW